MQKGTMVVCADYDESAPRIIAVSAYDPKVHKLWVEQAPSAPVVTPEPLPAEPLRWFQSEENAE